MVQENEYGKKLRVLKVMIMLIERPFSYTLKQLASRTGVQPGTIKKDIQAIKDAGIKVSHDKKYCYGFEFDNTYNELKDLLQFSEKDQLMLISSFSSNYILSSAFSSRSNLSKRSFLMSAKICFASSSCLGYSVRNFSIMVGMVMYFWLFNIMHYGEEIPKDWGLYCYFHVSMLFLWEI